MWYRRTAIAVLLGSFLLTVARADVEIVAETNSQVPGEAADVEFSQLRAPVIGRAGHVAFGAEMRGPGIITAGVDSNNEVIFAGIPRALRKVVQEKDPAPGTDPGVVFFNVPRRVAGTYNRIVVSDSGEVAIFAVLTGEGVDAFNNDGVWAEIDGSLVLIAREGQLLPSGATLARLFDFAFTDAGVVLFVSADPGSSEIWLYRNGALELIVAAGDPAPGFINCTISGLWRPVASPSGKLAFRAQLLADVGGANCPRTMYLVDGGSVVPAVSQGDLVPGLPGGTTMGSFSSGANILLPKINEHGDLIVHGGVNVPGGECGGSPEQVFSSSWVVRADGGLELLATECETMPSDAGVRITGLSNEGVINAVGHSAMLATLSTGTAVLAGKPRADFDYDPITNIGPIDLTEVARIGEPAVGRAGSTYAALQVPFTNNSGHVAFNGTVDTGGNCLWTGPPGELTLVLCFGQELDVIDPPTGLRVETAGAFLALTQVSGPDGSGTGDGLANPLSDTGQVVTRVSFLTTGTTAIVISPADPVDTDSDGIPDYLEGGGDLDGDGQPNFDDLDADGDGTEDAVDTCPSVANPDQGPAPFGQLVAAANSYRLEWPVAIPFVAIRGSFATPMDIGAFVVDDARTVLGRDLPISKFPAPGTGFWYLLRPHCEAGSWVSGSAREVPGRDLLLP